MFIRAVLRVTLIVFVLCIGAKGRAQSSICPPNIDFKSGNFDNWQCLGGIVALLGGVNTPTWNHFLPDPARHQLIPPTNTERDKYGGFLKHSPNPNSYSVRLGSEIPGHEADGLFYTFTIPSTATKFSLLYNYAIVLQNPGHRAEEQPRFRARIIDVAENKEVNCVSFDFTSSGSLPGFLPTLTGDGVYKDWTPVSVDLSSYAGKTIRLEFITSDCIFQEHFGYAYISVGSICNGSIIGSNYCEGDSSTVLTAPHGFQTYQWYSDATFTTNIGSLQKMRLDISTTPPGTILPVILTPYPGYGCVDTLYAFIGREQRPVSDAGTNSVSCSKQASFLGGVNHPDYEYSWTPAQFLSDAFASNPHTILPILTPTDFVVKTTDLLTGCSSLDTVTLTPIVVDTSTSVMGEVVYCPGESLATTFTVNTPNSVVQWYKGNTAIAGATGASYRPSSVGAYWAEIRQFGCVDSSWQHVLHQASMPKSDFMMSKDIQCLNEPIVFTNKTTIAGNEPVTYLWKFSDGLSSAGINTEKTFNKNGIYTTTLIATSGTDCSDSVQKQVMIINDCVPILSTGFTPNNDGKNDGLKPFLPGAKGLKRFTVYNRWGNIVFSTTKEGYGWDGSNNGQPLQTDVFVWTVEYISKDNQTMMKKGTVTLIR